MNVLITGGGGFVGVRLARALLAQGSVSLAGAAAVPITRLTLADRAPPPAGLAADPRVSVVEGDLTAQLASKQLPAAGTDLIFHLAAAVSSECEADLDLGLDNNLAATLALLQNCRALGTAPVLVFSSTMAVYGGVVEIDDHTWPKPQGSYGIQKFMCEQLMADFTRRGLVRGRSVRLATVTVRPGRPNGAASSFMSGMIREPLAGERGSCPVGPEVAVALSSPASTVQGLLRAAQASEAEWGERSAVNLPALCTTVGAMAKALEHVAGPEAAALLDWTPDARIAALVSTWPGVVTTARANKLGLFADADFEQIVRDYMRENPQAVRVSKRT